MTDTTKPETPVSADAPRDSRREAMLKLAKGAAYVAPATLALLEGTKNALAY
jgi:hypothetical protein